MTEDATTATNRANVDFIREQSARIQRILAILANLIAVLIGFGVPLLILLIGATDYRLILKAEMARKLVVISNVLYANPEIGPLEQILLQEVLERDIGQEYQLSGLKLTLADGREVLRLGLPPDLFTVTQSAPVRDGAKILGAMSGGVDLNPILIRALYSLLISIPLGITIFAALRFGPNRIARLSFERMTEMEHLVAANLAGLNKAQRIAGLGSWERDLSSSRRRWSESGLNLYGHSAGITDRNDWDWLAGVHPDDRPLLLDAVDRNARTGEDRKVQYRLQRPDNVTLIMEEQIEALRDSSGAIAGQTGVFQDITERQSMASQLAQSVKLEAIGNLTGGLAHDFNNYLGIVIGNLDLVKESPTADPATKALIDNALNSALQGAELIKSLLAFSRKQPLDPRPTDINQRLDGLIKLLKRTLGADVEIIVALDPDIWQTRLDGAQLDSCLINLANNARDAMPGGGKLTFSTRNARLDADYAKMNPEAAPGDYVLIEITDTGTGMPPETLARVFDPFFTTKGKTKGTGLGLSMVHGFVKQTGGHIKIYSEEGYGTTLRIYLPRVDSDEVTRTDASLDQVSAVERTEIVLVVDDHEMMRQTAIEQLGSLGYRAIEAHDGASAMAILKQDERRVDLLFTDVVMPGGMNGYELATLARNLRPDLKILLTSGFPGGSMLTDDKADWPLLNKPYRKMDLDRAVRTALDSPLGPAIQATSRNLFRS